MRRTRERLALLSQQLISSLRLAEAQIDHRSASASRCVASPDEACAPKRGVSAVRAWASVRIDTFSGTT